MNGKRYKGGIEEREWERMRSGCNAKEKQHQRRGVYVALYSSVPVCLFLLVRASNKLPFN